MIKATELGEQSITFLILAFIYWCVDKHTGVLMAFNVSIACTWNQFIKWKCRIDRTWVRDERSVPVQEAIAGAGGYSFPSGHTSPCGERQGLPCGKERNVSFLLYAGAFRR
ncbi:MAG: hypothetical protein K2N15_13955 [Lachnospiraceae bacterium]|nr:hypothetical protein [Lachnospiraceae bacterium]